MVDKKPTGPITVQWAFVAAVNSDGEVDLVDHEFVVNVKAKRVATLDDINAAAFLGSKELGVMPWINPGDLIYSTAFLVFQMPDGFIAASPNVFENIVPVTGPSTAQVLGAFGVLQNQIIAQRTADLAAPLAIQAALSFLRNEAEKTDPDAKNKTPGGLIRV